MRKRLMSALLCLLLLSSCAPARGGGEEAALQVLCTTYPVYLFATAVTQGAAGAEVSLLVDQPTACLHDYTLTVKDMRAIEGADVILMNGVGLEDFMADALEGAGAAVIDCSAGVELLPALEGGGHDHEHEHDHDHDHEHDHDSEGEYDPHIWMDPSRAAVMVENIAAGLEGLDGGQADIYRANAERTGQALRELAGRPGAAPVPLITFHDGFQYFADAFGFPLLKAIEEEDGATASAREIKEVAELIESYDGQALPVTAIFVEKNGSRTSAEVIARETGCEIYELDMVMSGDGAGIEPYLEAITSNVDAILGALREKEAEP